MKLFFKRLGETLVALIVSVLMVSMVIGFFMLITSDNSVAVFIGNIIKWIVLAFVSFCGLLVLINFVHWLLIEPFKKNN